MKWKMILLVSVCLWVSISWAAEYYISSSTGNDSNPGTEVQPWKTFTKINYPAATRPVPGDTVYLKRGDVWHERMRILNYDGSENNRITFSAYGEGANPVIKSCDDFSNWFEYSKIGNGGLEIPGSDSTAFETWAEVVDGGLSGDISRDTGIYHQGLSSAKLHYDGISTNVYIYQDVTLAENTGYTFRCYKCVSSGGKIRIRIHDTTNDKYLDGIGVWQSGTVDLDFTEQSWSQFSVSFTSASSGSSVVRIYFYNKGASNTDAWVDEAYLDESAKTAKIWQGYIAGIRTTLGAVKDGQRVPMYAPLPLVDPDTIADMTFCVGTNQSTFCYRNDVGYPGTLEVGTRYNCIGFQPYSCHITYKNIDLYGPQAVDYYDYTGGNLSSMLIIRCDDIIFQDLSVSNISGVGAYIYTDSTNCAFINVKSFNNGDTGLYAMFADSGNRFINCEVYDNATVYPSMSGDRGGIGVYCSEDTLIEGCYVHDNGTRLSAPDAAISCVAAPRTVITRCVVKDSSATAIQIASNSHDCEVSYNVIDTWGYTVSGNHGHGLKLGSMPPYSDNQNCKIFNNLFINGGVTAGNYGAIMFTTDINFTGSQIRNNIFCNNLGVYEILVGDDANMTDVVFSNNCFYRTGGNAIYWKGSIYDYEHIIGSSSGYYSYDKSQEQKSIADNPDLFDPDEGKYWLGISSPCIDAGYSTGLSDDITGETVPIGPEYDIGPYEYMYDDPFAGPYATDSYTAYLLHFDEGSGQYLYDSSTDPERSAGYRGRTQYEEDYDPIWIPVTGFGYALSFDASVNGGQVVTIKTSNGGLPEFDDTGWTAEAWIKPYSSSISEEIIDGSGTLRLEFLSNGKIRGLAQWNSTPVQWNFLLTNTDVRTSMVNDGLWHHIALCYDPPSGEQTLWIDGEIYTDVSLTINGTGVCTNKTNSMGIGGYAYSTGNYNGIIDEVRITKGQRRFLSP